MQHRTTLTALFVLAAGGFLASLLQSMSDRPPGATTAGDINRAGGEDPAPPALHGVSRPEPPSSSAPSAGLALAPEQPLRPELQFREDGLGWIKAQAASAQSYVARIAGVHQVVVLERGSGMLRARLPRGFEEPSVSILASSGAPHPTISAVLLRELERTGASEDESREYEIAIVAPQWEGPVERVTLAIANGEIQLVATVAVSRNLASLELSNAHQNGFTAILRVARLSGLAELTVSVDGVGVFQAHAADHLRLLSVIETTDEVGNPAEFRQGLLPMGRRLVLTDFALELDVQAARKLDDGRRHTVLVQVTDMDGTEHAISETLRHDQ